MKIRAFKTTFFIIIVAFSLAPLASHASESVAQVKTVAPDPSNTLNTGKPLNTGEPLVAFNPFDSNSYLQVFSKKEKDESIKYNGKLAYNTNNIVYTDSQRINNVYETDFVTNSNEGYVNGKKITKVRGIRANNGVASVGQAGVVLARNGQLNYGVLLLILLLLVIVVVLARLTLRKGKRLAYDRNGYMQPMMNPYQQPQAPTGYEMYPPQYSQAPLYPQEYNGRNYR